MHHDVGGPLEECKGGKKCPLGVLHPPASHKPREGNFPLGCSLCLFRKAPKYKSEQNAPFQEVELEEEKKEKIRKQNKAE